MLRQREDDAPEKVDRVIGWKTGCAMENKNDRMYMKSWLS